MAEVHNALTRGVLSAALKNALGATKTPGGLERFGETLTPNIDLWSRPEWSILRNEYLFSLQIAVGAVALEFGGGGIVCLPATANQAYLVVVDRISGTTSTAGGGWELRAALRASIAATYAAGGNPPARDFRTTTNPAATVGVAPVETFTGTDPAGVPGNILERRITTVAFQETELTSPPYILTPGRGLIVQADTVNQSIRATFRGYVRVALRGELV